MSMRRKIAVFLLMILLVSALPAVSLAADGKAPEGGYHRELHAGSEL